MASSNNEGFCIAGSSTEDKLDAKLVAKFILSNLSLATKNTSAVTITSNLRVSLASQPCA